jgi:calcineurin-like phosphoesterase family protein
MRVWVTSDNHFYHKNIIKYCNRPFDSVDEMNAAMIEIWNSQVSENDIVFHLGDFSLAPANRVEWILQKLKGKKVLIFGNHDQTSMKKSPYWKGAFNNYTLQYKGKRIGMRHFPYQPSEMGKYDVYLHGHSHGNLGKIHDGGQIDMAVDCWDFSPVDIEEILEHG